jgi:hypothetical protein
MAVVGRILRALARLLGADDYEEFPRDPLLMVSSWEAGSPSRQ